MKTTEDFMIFETVLKAATDILFCNKRIFIKLSPYRSQVYIKKKNMLNSAEHEILNALKYKNMKKFSFFQAQISLECYFSNS